MIFFYPRNSISKYSTSVKSVFSLNNTGVFIMNELFVLCQAVNLFLLSEHPPPLFPEIVISPMMKAVLFCFVTVISLTHAHKKKEAKPKCREEICEIMLTPRHVDQMIITSPS